MGSATCEGRPASSAFASGGGPSYLEADEARFVTPEIIRNFCLAGQPDEIIQRLHELEADGLTGVNFALPTDTARELVEQFANQVVNRYLDS